MHGYFELGLGALKDSLILNKTTLPNQIETSLNDELLGNK